MLLPICEDIFFISLLRLIKCFKIFELNVSKQGFYIFVLFFF